MGNSYGASSWDDNPNTGRSQDRENLPRIPFARLQDGNNIVRIVTIPYKYFMVRVPTSPSDKVGKRVNTAYPLYDDCPAVAAGFKPKERYLVGIINRGTPGSDTKHEVNILDMSILVHSQVKAIKEDIEYGPPTGFDLNIRVNRDSGSPAGYYTVLPRQKSALSEADVLLLEEVGDDLQKTLVRLSTPTKSEYVLERMQKLGWTPSEPTVSKDEGSSELSNTEEVDYSFDRAAN